MSEVAQVTHSSPDGHIPQLRFPQFSHDWAISTIGNLAKIDTGNRDTQDRVNSGKYPFYVRSNTVERINEYAFDGEAILTSGDGVGVGKNFHYVVGKFNYHQRVYSIHNFTNSTNGKFIYYYFADKFYRRVSRLSAKNSVDSVRMSMISDMPISIPAKPEQQKIAAFLTAVDNKIEQLIKKQELLGEYKKGLMQQIFSQAIRFKADDGGDYPDWEELKLGEVARFRRGSFPQPYGNPEWYDDEDGKPFVQVYDVAGNMRLKSTTKRKISVLAQSSSVFVPKGNVVLTIQGSIGRIALTQYDAYVDRTLLIFTGYIKEVNKQFFIYVIYLLFEIEKIKAPGGTIKTITKEALTSFKLDLPCFDEQTKIANFLSSIDSKIEQVGKQLDESKQFKKALLQQMFV